MHHRWILPLLLLATGAAAAHDTWFERRADGSLQLGTGTQFPKQETPLDPQWIARQGCDAGSCWAQSAPFELTLDPARIPLYLDEVRPDAALLQAWQAMQARGLPWVERYAKHARIVTDPAAAATPSGMAMDVLLWSDGPLRRGRPLTLQLLRDGLPLPHFAVELRSDRSRFGLWRRTDDQGRLVFTPPFAAAWLLRGVDLRLATQRPDSWDSRFVTLAFEVAD